MTRICKICGRKEVEPYFPGDSRVLKCLSCGTGFLDNDLVIKNLGNYYTGRDYATRDLKEEKLKIAAAGAREVLNFISEFIEPQHKKLLDVGANAGMFVKEANNFGFDAKGIEASSEAVNYARNHGIPVSRFKVEDYEPSEKFDVVTVFHVLEHVKDPVLVLNKLKKWLNNSGYLAIEVPNLESHLAKRHGPSWKFIALEHIFYFSEKSLLKLLKDHGFEIIAVRKRNFEINYLNIRKLVQYILGAKIHRERLKPKSFETVSEDVSRQSLSKNLVRKFLIFLINRLGRQDHILILAKKHEKNFR